jgi:Holliday junction DNA helicase RuvA
MIGKIKGQLTEIHGNTGYIETNGGVYYLVFLPPNLISISDLPKEINIYTYLHVREDALILFGFEARKIYDLFIQLISISGVGPKMAFTIISFLQYEDLVMAIQNSDVDALTKVPGLGKKTAMKIIIEISQKLKKEIDLSSFNITEEEQTIIDTLHTLGFEQEKIKKIIKQLPQDIPLEEQIKEAIRLLSKK